MRLNINALWDALGWAILHSLWQAALIGLLVWALRGLVTERRAQLRYLAGMGGLVAIFGAFLATFTIVLMNRLETSVLGLIDMAAPASSSGASDLSLSVSVLPVQDFQGDMALALVPWLGMIWAVGFMFLSLQAYRAWFVTRQLATEGLHNPAQDWSDRFSSLIKRSRASQRVKLYISDYVSGPLTLGTLRPIVLVPVGFLTSMPASQVEAILLHELAHIRRHDFLFGLIQTAIKTVLYFNPAVLIVSRWIDADREQACDDIAVNICGRPVDLVKGLAQLRLGSSAPVLTMAADGGPLLARLNRLMGRPAARHNTNKLSAAAISVLVLGSAAISSVSTAHPNSHEAPEAPEVVLADTLIMGEKGTEFMVHVENMPELPPMPAMPEVPAMPAVPSMPVTPVMPATPSIPVPLPNAYDSEQEFEAAMEAWGEKMEVWGESIGAQFDEDWEAKMEAWGEQMEVWGEEVEARFDEEWEVEMEAWGEKMEAWGEEVEAITENHDGEYESFGWNEDRIAQHREEVRNRAERDAAKNMARVKREAARVLRDRERVQRDAEREVREAARRVRDAARSTERNREELRHQSRSYSQGSRTLISGSDNRVVINEADSKVRINDREVDVEKMRKHLIKKLTKDGLMGRSGLPVKLSFCSDEMKVGQKKVSAERAKEYSRILKDAGLVTDSAVKIVLLSDATQVTMSGKDDRDGLTLTFGTFDTSNKK